MIRATVARGLRLLACLVDGSDPAALALSEALRAQGEARRALEAAERTRGVVAAMLREGVFAERAPTRGRELLREVEGEG